MAILLFLGNPRNNQPFLEVQVKLNIVPWKLQPQKLLGWSDFSKNLVFPSFNLLFSTVTILVPFILEKIPFSMNALSTREKILDGLIELHHLPTSEKIADIMTKAFPFAQHSKLLSKLGMSSVDSLHSLGGGVLVIMHDGHDHLITSTTDASA